MVPWTYPFNPTGVFAMAKNPTLIDDNIIRVIRKFMIFEDLTTQEIKALFATPASDEAGAGRRTATISGFRTGEAVIRAGAMGSRTYWVIRGGFEVIQEGARMAVFDKPGQIFGEMSVLEGIPRTASVRCVKGGICLAVDMRVLEAIENDGVIDRVKKGFYRVILRRLQKTKAMVREEKNRLEMQLAQVLKFESEVRKKAGALGVDLEEVDLL